MPKPNSFLELLSTPKPFKPVQRGRKLSIRATAIFLHAKALSSLLIRARLTRPLWHLIFIIMIPYIEIPPLMIWGSIAIQPFGLLVLTGCILGFFVARWYAGSQGLAQGRFFELAVWVLVPGFTLSHLVAMLLYFPQTVRSDPISLLNLAGAMSSFGGFFGGGLGAIIYMKINKLPILDYGEASLVGLVVGWFFGRLGCTIAHDHPGIHTDFFLAVKYPDGARHDLGFYEWLFTIGLIVILTFIRRAGFPPGAIVGAVSILYGLVRFMLDFLRVGDKLYFGLTAGQYFSVILIPLGIYFLFKAYKKRGLLFPG